jgi:RNA polymerase sigma-70 factor, ECF subfamily
MLTLQKSPRSLHSSPMDLLPNDIELMQGIAARDGQAFQTLYQHYGKAVYSLACRILHNTALAEEVTQDTFLKVWQRRTQWDPEKGRLKNWLLTITHYTAIDRLRKERRQPDLHPDSIEEVEESTHELRHESFWQDGTTLRMLVAQLSQEQAHLIHLAFFQGMSHSDIASVTAIPLGTVKTRLRAGLQRLRELWMDSVKDTSKLP